MLALVQAVGPAPLLMASSSGSTLQVVIGLVLGVVFAIVCNRIATRKGRGPVLWAILGFFFGLIALIIIAVLPRKDGVPA